MRELEAFLERERMRDVGSDAEMMRACLAQMEHPAPTSQLLMEHSGFGMPGIAPAGTRVLLVDAGGTNLRVAEGLLDGSGAWEIRLLRRTAMPGDGAPLSAEAFFREIAGAVAPFACEDMPIGFCFSYTIRHLPDGDAEVLSLAKQVRIDGLEGKAVGRELAVALRGVGGPRNARVTVLNDVVAVLLAGALPQLGNPARAALVMGTGVNFALFAPDAVNVEASRFNGFVRAPADVEMDRKSTDPCEFPFEKSVAGRYLGDLVLTVAQRAATQGLFSMVGAEALARTTSLPTRELSEWLEERTAVPASSHDTQVFRRIADAVMERAARRLAIFSASVLEHAGAGTSPEPAVLQTEGSTIEKFRPLRRKMMEHLGKIARERGFSFKTCQLGNAVLVGTAVAATRLQEEKHR